MFISIFLHPYVAPFDPLLRKNINVFLNPPNFGGHSEDFRPLLLIRRKIPKIGGAERSAITSAQGFCDGTFDQTTTF